MTAVDPRTACIIGVAQRTYRNGDNAPEPLAMWEQVARAAADDAGHEGLLGRLDTVALVVCQSWQYDDGAGRLCERLGAPARRRLMTGAGGTSPQVAVQEAAAAIGRGDTDLALVAGAEALATVRTLAKAGAQPEWSHPATTPPDFGTNPFHPSEMANELYRAPLAFALFETARRAHFGTGVDEHRARLGRLLAPFSTVAAANPHAWFPVARTGEELVTPTPENRMAAYPYTKLMTAFMDVDMAAAVIVASNEMADSLGVDPSKRVYLRGWCAADDAPFVAERPELWRSPAMEAAIAEAMASATVGVDDIAHLDLYSCFASAVQFGAAALGIDDNDSRQLTVTGGLPYFGGPASNYMTHSIASMVETLRADPGSFGLVSGVGMLMSKHVAAVYSSQPGPIAVPRDESGQAARAVAPRQPIHTSYTGEATVAAYSLWHGRDSAPEWGVAVCDTADAARCYARLVEPDMLRHAEESELVGARVQIVAGDGELNVVKG
ncbi:MAG: acetyl-CoA C-acetyltransferase [Acidimicrobiaceae bacterium]|jgi:acetyl-CoA C-acetyltransferase